MNVERVTIQSMGPKSGYGKITFRYDMKQERVYKPTDSKAKKVTLASFVIISATRKCNQTWIKQLVGHRQQQYYVQSEHLVFHQR